MTPPLPGFTVRIDQNSYIPVGSRTVHAIIRVRSKAATPGSGGAGSHPDAAEVIVIDTSSSMTGRKIEMAREAAARAVEVLRDGTYFAVIAGQSFAKPVYPAAGLARSSAATRKEAAQAVAANVSASGGTRMSEWLKLTRRTLESCPAEIKHATVLTDGQNVEAPEILQTALDACAGQFICDCRGVGDDWSYVELREIARTLLGTWAPVATPDLLVEDFRKMMMSTMDKRVAGVVLRVTLPAWGGEVSYFAQVMPSIEDLTPKGVTRDARTVEFPLGDWGEQVADYHLRIETGESAPYDTAAHGRAAMIEVLAPTGEGGAQTVVAGGRLDGSVKVRWTADIELSGPIDPLVAVYTGQEEVADAVEAAIVAWKAGRSDTAQKFGDAVRLAHDQNNDDVLERLAAFVVIDDPALGHVRLRPRYEVSRGSDNELSHASIQSQSAADDMSPSEGNPSSGEGDDG